MNKFQPLLKAVTICSFLVLTACGGGGGGNNDSANNTNPPDTTTPPDDGGGGSGNGNGGEVPRDRRINAIQYDFDNNGAFEGRAALDYDSEGRIEQIRYEYVFDDGVPDTDFRTFSLGFGQEDTTHDYAYDIQGRLESWIITTDGSRQVNLYTWNDDNLVTNYAIEFYDGAGGLQNTVRFDLTYDAGQLGSWSEEVEPTGSGSMALADATLTYDAATGLSSLVSRTDNLSSVTENIAYAFNANGTIERITTTTPSDPDFENVFQFSYEDETIEGIGEYHIAEKRALTNNPDDAYSWVYIYSDGSPNTELDDGLLENVMIDMNSDGTFEANIKFDYDIGFECLPVYLWQPRAEPNFIAGGHEPFIPATGYVRLDYCDTRGSRL